MTSAMAERHGPSAMASELLTIVVLKCEESIQKSLSEVDGICLKLMESVKFSYHCLDVKNQLS